MKTYTIPDISELAIKALQNMDFDDFEIAAAENDRIYTEICEKILSGEYIGAKVGTDRSFRTLTKSSRHENTIQETAWMTYENGEIVPLMHHDVTPGNTKTYEYKYGIYEIEED